MIFSMLLDNLKDLWAEFVSPSVFKKCRYDLSQEQLNELKQILNTCS